MFNPELWQIIDFKDRTLGHRALAIASLARVIGAVLFHLASPWTSFPWRVLRMVDPDRDAAEERESFLASCPHLFDPFASDIRARFGTQDLLNSNERKVLLIVLLFCN